MSEEKDKHRQSLTTGQKVIRAFLIPLWWLVVMIIASILFTALCFYLLLPAIVFFLVTGIDNNSLGILVLLPVFASAYVMWAFAGGKRLTELLADL